jgi:hypothetical protein
MSLHRLALGLRGQLVVLVDESAEHAAASDVGEGRRNGGVPRHRRLETEVPMWPVLVVVPDVLGERLFQVRSPRTRVQSRHSLRTVRTKRSA